MKRVYSLLTGVFIFLHSFYSISQENVPLLLPELNTQYIYEVVHSEYIPHKGGEKYTDLVKRKKLKIQYKTTQPDNRNYLFVSLIENVVQRPDFDPVLYNDYRFPYFKDGFYKNRGKELMEELLSAVTLYKYEFSQDKREVKLYNRGEVLLQVRAILGKKGYDKNNIDWYTDQFNTTGIPVITHLLQTIFFVSDEIQKTTKKQSFFFSRKDNVSDSLVTFVYDEKNNSVGLQHWEYSYQAQKHFLTDFLSTETDTLKWPATVFNERHKLFYKDQNIRLLSRKEIPVEKLFLSGTIGNVRNKKVTVGILRHPFGTDLHTETVYLDENNSFKLETDFSHAGMVHLQFGQEPDARNLPLVAFYAEPGSRIHLRIDGKSFPEDVQFEGDYSRIAKTIHEFRAKYGWSFGSFNANPIYAFLHHANYKNFHDALINFSSFAGALKDEVDEQVVNYITAEMKAQVLIMAFYYLRAKENWVNTVFNRPNDPDLAEIDVAFIERQVNNYNILESYRNYGIYSRLLAGEMLDYYYTRSRRVSYIRPSFSFGRAVVFSEYSYVNDLPHQVEVAKNILAGHALYSQLAQLLQQEKMWVADDRSKDVRWLQNKMEEYLDLMLRRVNDKEFVNAVSLMMNIYRRWQKEDYVPEAKFLNVQGEQLSMDAFFGQKPSIFFVTNNWGVDRYYWDELARENPEINFVLIMGGSNFSEWTDYIRRADPVAHQLFWKNTKLQLKDLFTRDYHHFIVYNKEGKRIGFAENSLDAVTLVKQSLREQTSEPNKSQLILFIVVLGALLISTLLVLIVWKWKIRKRMQKEQQQRRLRELELTAIRSRMNPHFLFNCLNSVQNLVQQNKGREAHRYLADFAGLIRKVLNNSEKEEVSLAEELDMMQQYLNLEKLRFDFNYHLIIDDEVDIYTTSVPSMLLQPFAENAVIHGLQNKPGDRQLKIDVAKNNETAPHKDSGKGIIISLEDNGIGRVAAQKIATQKNGKGTKLMQERLAILRQKNHEKYWLHTIDLNDKGKTGTKVEIFVPEEN